MAVRRRVLVTGRVQGVFFRDACRREASSAGVSGWVRNLPDGGVEACFEGEADAVARLVEWCRRGPPHALITHIDVVDELPTGANGFEIRW